MANPVKISYRISLLIAIPALVLLLGGIVTWRSYRATMRETEDLAHRLFRDVSEQVFYRTREHLNVARQTMLLLQELSDLGRLSTDQKSLGAELLSILRSQPDYSWISYSSEEGAFVGAYRASDGATLVNRSWILDGKSPMEEYAVGPDGEWTLVRKSDDSGYDPRTRPFYERAARQGTGIWTQPYVFFGQGIPGITYAAPRWGVDRRRLGVFSVDFDLNRLSDLTRQAVSSGAGTMFMFTPDHTLLAHPAVKCVELEEGKAGRLLKLTDVQDPVLRAYAAEISGADPESIGRLSFRAAGEDYMAAGTAYRVDDELTLVVGMAAPSTMFLGALRENLHSALGITLLVLAAGLVVAALLANAVARPLLRMSAEMDRVGAFDLREDLEGRSVFEEIYRMERALGSMIGSLRSFAAYVPRELVRQLVTSGRAARLEGETRRLTVFFSDVAGFTTISERLAPAELVTLLGDYLSEVTSAVVAEGGTVDKFLGDGVLAFWNAPTPQADHARRAVHAALALQRRLAALRAPAAPAPAALPTRIGLATGELVVGNVGTPERMNYTVIGDIANLAARLEALNKTYGTSILVSEGTVTDAGSSVVFRTIDRVAVVGKDEAVRVFEPLCSASDPEAGALRELAAATERAFDAYACGRLDEALRLYRQLPALRPGDPVAAVMVARCEDLRRSGLPADWSGVTRIRSK